MIAFLVGMGAGLVIGWVARALVGIDRARGWLHSEAGRRFLDNLERPKDDEEDQ